MNWACAQLNQRLHDFLEDRLSAPEQAAAQAHARSCPRCGEWADAHLAASWLRQLEGLETPPGLETRILAQTVAPPAQEGFWSVLGLGWRALRQPRLALGLAAALFSLGLVLNTLDVSMSDIRAADLNPVNIYRSINRQAHLTYARGARFVNDLWLVYEIRSRLEEMAPEREPPPASAPSDSPTAPASENEKQPKESISGGRAHWLLAWQNLGGVGDLR